MFAPSIFLYFIPSHFYPQVLSHYLMALLTQMCPCLFLSHF